MTLRGRYGQQPPALDPGELPATLVDHPVVVVAEKDQVVHVRPAAVAPVHQVMPVNPQMYVETVTPNTVDNQMTGVDGPAAGSAGHR